MQKKDILQDIFRTLQKQSNKNAFVIDDEAYTYNQLNQRVGGIIKTLSTIKEKRIGIIADNNIETYATILALLMVGKTYVILHPSYPDNRNLKIAQSAEINTLFYTDNSKPEVFNTSDFKLIDTRALTASSIKEIDCRVDSSQNAYIIFTSGSTGEPKGVPITRANLNAFYTAYADLGWRLNENDRMLQMFELTFDVSVVSLLYPLTLGCCIYPVGHKEVKFLKVFDILERDKITFAAIAPSLLQLFSPYFKEIHLPALNYLIVTAEAAQATLLEQFRPSAPNAEFVNLYGPTEATIYCTAYPIPSTGCKHYNGMIAIGKPFKNIDVIITNEKGAALPSGEKGELWVAGQQVMKGYLNDPEKSTAALVKVANGKTYYKTGDLCIQDNEGDIIYCGRKDYQVKIQGFRIELSEIEYTAKCFFEHPCNVVVIPVSQKGICSELHMVIETSQCDKEALHTYLKDKLPYYMLPKQVHCMPLFPVTCSNKTDRKKITELI